jgi:hypothetical protein
MLVLIIGVDLWQGINKLIAKDNLLQFFQNGLGTKSSVSNFEPVPERKS